MISIICGICKQTNKQTKHQKKPHSKEKEIRLVVARGGGGGKGELVEGGQKVPTPSYKLSKY